eukprot:gene7530-11854_t
MNKKVVNIDGNIGAGKSSLIKKLTKYVQQHHKNVTTFVIEENVDRDSTTKTLLKNYYQKPKQYAIEFQLWILKDKLEQFDKIDNPDSVIIFDRSLMADKMFCETQYQIGNITEEDFILYSKLYQELMKKMSMCDVLNIYLNTNVKHCLQRISKRARDGESNIKDTYLQKLEDKYIDLYSNLNKFELNGNVSLKEFDNCVNQIVSKIF